MSAANNTNHSNHNASNPPVYANFLNNNASSSNNGSSQCSTSCSYPNPYANNPNPYSHPSQPHQPHQQQSPFSLSSQPVPSNYLMSIPPPLFPPHSQHSNYLSHPDSHGGNGAAGGGASGNAAPANGSSSSSSFLTSVPFGKVACILLSVLFVAGISYFLYRYYQQKKNMPVAPFASASASAGGNTLSSPKSLEMQEDNKAPSATNVPNQRIRPNSRKQEEEDSDFEDEQPLQPAKKVTNSAAHLNKIQNFHKQQNEQMFHMKSRIQQKFDTQENLIMDQSRKIHDLESNTNELTQEIDNLKLVLQAYKNSLKNVASHVKRSRYGSGPVATPTVTPTMTTIPSHVQHAHAQHNAVHHVPGQPVHALQEETTEIQSDPLMNGQATLVSSVSSAETLNLAKTDL